MLTNLLPKMVVVLVGVILLWVTPAGAHSYGFVATGLTSNGYPTGSSSTTVWDTIPSDSTRYQCLNEVSANDNDYIRLAGSKTAGQSCIVKVPIDTTVSNLSGSDRRVDSFVVNWRIKDDGWSGKVEILYDSGAGTLFALDTATSTTSFVNHRSTKVTGKSKNYLTSLRIFIRNPDAVAANDTLWCSHVVVQVYASQRSDAFLIYHDTADFRIGQISNDETFDDVWTGNRLFFGAYAEDTVRLAVSIVNVDTLRTNKIIASTLRPLDSAFLYFMTDSVVGTPGYSEHRSPFPQTGHLNQARSIYHGRIDDDSACHSDWDHYHASAEGAGQICTDTVRWTTYGASNPGGDYVPSPVDTFSFTQSSTKKVDITEWLRQIHNTPAGLTGPFSKYYYNGNLSLLPVAEYAAHVVRDTLEVSADGDTVGWDVSPGSGADYLYVDEVTAATDSIVRITGLFEITKMNTATEMFNFPNDTAYGATLDSIRILVHARYNEAAGDCAINAADSIIFIYDTTSSLGWTRLSKFSLTTSWATYTSAKIVSPSKAAIVQLQAGFRNFSDICAEGTAQDYHEVAWIAVERFFATTNKRVKVGNVRPLTANDSSWMEIFYHDEGALDADPGVGQSDKVVNYKDTTDIVVGELDRAVQTASDGLFGKNTMTLRQISGSFHSNAIFVLRDTSAITSDFPKNQYVIDSAKLNVFLTAKGTKATKIEVHPVFRGWRAEPKRFRQAAWEGAPLNSAVTRNTQQYPYSQMNIRKTIMGDTLWANADGDTVSWVPNTGSADDWKYVYNRDPLTPPAAESTLVSNQGTASQRTQLLKIGKFYTGGSTDTSTWNNAVVVPDSFRIVVQTRYTTSVTAADSMWIIFDTVSGLGWERKSKFVPTTSFAFYKSPAIAVGRNTQIANLQVGVYPFYDPAGSGEVAHLSWIGIERFYPEEQDSSYWRSAGAGDSTTTDSADVAASVDTSQLVGWAAGSYIYATSGAASLYVTSWADSMQHGYGSSPDKNTKWGNALTLIFFADQSGSTGQRTATISNVYPVYSNAAQSFELHVWGSDTTTGGGFNKWRRRKILVPSQGARDQILKATGWLAIEAEQPKPWYDIWNRETRVTFAQREYR